MNRDGVYGNLSADPRVDDLWHVASCASGQTFSMDFEFRSNGIVGLEVEDGDVDSTVQVCLRVRTCVSRPVFVRVSVTCSCSLPENNECWKFLEFAFLGVPGLKRRENNPSGNNFCVTTPTREVGVRQSMGGAQPRLALSAALFSEV